MRSLLGGEHTLQVLRQNALKLEAIHLQPLSPIPLWLLILFWPYQLCSSGGAHVISTGPCATATYYCRSNNRPFRQSHCARSPPRRAVQRSYDSPVVTRQPPFAVATAQLIPSGARRAHPVPS